MLKPFELSNEVREVKLFTDTRAFPLFTYNITGLSAVDVGPPPAFLWIKKKVTATEITTTATITPIMMMGDLWRVCLALCFLLVLLFDIRKYPDIDYQI